MNANGRESQCGPTQILNLLFFASIGVHSRLTATGEPAGDRGYPYREIVKPWRRRCSTGLAGAELRSSPGRFDLGERLIVMRDAAFQFVQYFRLLL